MDICTVVKKLDSGKPRVVSRAVAALGISLAALPSFASPVLKSTEMVRVPLPFALIPCLIIAGLVFAGLMRLDISAPGHPWTEPLICIAAAAGSAAASAARGMVYGYWWVRIAADGWTLTSFGSLAVELSLDAAFPLLFFIFMRFIKPMRFMAALPAVLSLLTPSLRRGGKVRARTSSVILRILICILGAAALGAMLYKEAYFTGMEMGAVMITLRNANGAFNPELIWKALPYAVIAALYAAWAFLAWSRPCPLPEGFRPFRPWESSFIRTVVFLVVPLAMLSDSVSLGAYLRHRFTASSIYEEHYVDPDSVVAAPEHKKNLVFIIAESMESSLGSFGEGGCREDSLIPGLMRLAEDNISFARFENLEAYSYTAGSTVGMTAGASYGPDGLVPSGVRSLEDILHDAGYIQMQVMGSKREFAGFGSYAGRYDDSMLFDYSSAVDLGYIPEGYWENWGIEDAKLFEWSRGFIGRMHDTGRPFAITICTMDTHSSEGGYVCPDCREGAGRAFESAAECSSRRICAFVEWLKSQPCWEDTVVVIQGDHLIPAYDDGLFDGDEDMRMVYSCIINSGRAVPTDMKERTCCSADMFPTILSSLGFTVESGRCGLGTDLFSGIPTLCEELGADTVDDELASWSRILGSVSGGDASYKGPFILDLLYGEVFPEK